MVVLRLLIIEYVTFSFRTGSSNRQRQNIHPGKTGNIQGVQGKRTGDERKVQKKVTDVGYNANGHDELMIGFFLAEKKRAEKNIEVENCRNSMRSTKLPLSVFRRTSTDHEENHRTKKNSLQLDELNAGKNVKNARNLLLQGPDCPTIHLET
ncbi:hypothetical protein RUM43_012547 [Polyplax serrata]|uniref:Uncharacterized protein n=1 Tax=Polyplax serrata TaxID=468196 RepID=A0AAN8S0G3_POLSC